MPKDLVKKLYWLDIPKGRWWGVVPRERLLRKIAVTIDGEPYDTPKIRFYSCVAVEGGVVTEIASLWIPAGEFEENTGQPLPKSGTRIWIACYMRFIGYMHNLKKREIWNPPTTEK